MCASLYRFFHFFFFSFCRQIVAERVHVRVFHRPDQTTAEHHVLRQRFDANRLGRRRRGHHRKVHSAGPSDLHDRTVRPDDTDFGAEGFQVSTSFCGRGVVDAGTTGRNAACAGGGGIDAGTARRKYIAFRTSLWNGRRQVTLRGEGGGIFFEFALRANTKSKYTSSNSRWLFESFLDFRTTVTTALYSHVTKVTAAFAPRERKRIFASSVFFTPRADRIVTFIKIQLWKVVFSQVFNFWPPFETSIWSRTSICPIRI